MSRGSPPQVLSIAAARVLGRIRSDAGLAEGKVQEILEHLYDHLFSEDLSVKTLLASLRIHGRAVRLEFRRAVGVTLQEYLETARLETAARLLRLAPEMLVKDVSHLVGYGLERTFFGAFKRVYGVTPSGYRERWFQSEESEADDSAHEADEELIDGVFLEMLVSTPDEKRFNLALAGLHFKTPVAFREVLKRSREEFRDDRRRGVELAERALENLPNLRDQLSPQEYSVLRIEALAAVGNLRRLAGDWLHADEALRLAGAEARERTPPPQLEATIRLYLGLLRTHQRRLSDARKELGRGLEIVERADDERLYIQLLMLHGLTQELADEPRAALSTYLEARDLVKKSPEPDRYLEASVYSHLANGYGGSGDLDAARHAVGMARQVLGEDCPRSGLTPLLWLEGLLELKAGDAESARRKLNAAKRALLKLEEADNTSANIAILNLDLAALELSQGRMKAAVELASEALPELRARNLDLETLAALDLVEHAVQLRRLTTGAIRDLRRRYEFFGSVPRQLP